MGPVTKCHGLTILLVHLRSAREIGAKYISLFESSAWMWIKDMEECLALLVIATHSRPRHSTNDIEPGTQESGCRQSSSKSS